jgi:hypothetical protein
MQSVRCPVLVLAAVVLAASAAPAAAQPKARKVAFLVGVGTYKHGLRDLGDGPENDVRKLKELFAEHGFEVVLLTGTAAGKDQATKDNVDARFKAVLAGDGRPDKALRQGDILLITLCGHGLQMLAPGAAGGPVDQPFFCPYDAKIGVLDKLVSLNGMIRDAERTGATTLFLVDACRNMPAGPNLNLNVRAGIQGKKVNLSDGMAILFSCGSGQVSYQDNALRHGLFTWAVLETFRAKAAAGQQATWGGLVDGVQDKFVSADFQKRLNGWAQTPVHTAGEMGRVSLAGPLPDRIERRHVIRLDSGVDATQSIYADHFSDSKVLGVSEIDKDTIVKILRSGGNRHLIRWTADGKTYEAWVEKDIVVEVK